MRISLIAAMALNRVIGKGLTIPWHVPGEQRLFRNFTLGHSVIMGRVTHQSLKRPLDGRTNIVVTRNPSYHAPGCLITHTLDQALMKGLRFSKDLFVIGGESLFREALPRAHRIYLSTIQIHATGDTFFPEFDQQTFTVIDRKEVDGKIPYTFELFERKTNPQ